METALLVPREDRLVHLYVPQRARTADLILEQDNIPLMGFRFCLLDVLHRSHVHFLQKKKKSGQATVF